MNESYASIRMSFSKENIIRSNKQTHGYVGWGGYIDEEKNMAPSSVGYCT